MSNQGRSGLMKRGIQCFGILSICLFLLFLLPDTVKAGESVTGGESFEQATLIEFGKEYTTETPEGWFKVYAPENVSSISGGYDEFTSISAYDSNKRRLGCRDLGSNFDWVNWSEKTSYWNWNYGDYEWIEGNGYYYFEITSTKAEHCTFRIIYDVRFKSENRKLIQLRQEYLDTFYVASYFEDMSSDYRFTAADTGNYKVIFKSINGEGMCDITYKDGDAVTSIYCEENSTKEKIIPVKQGVTYYVKVWARSLGSNKTEPVQTAFQISNAKVSAITLNASTLSMNKGDQFQLTASVAPENAVNKAITYSSTNPQVAIVSEEGVVTAVRGGSATIVAEANDGSGVQATCSVAVPTQLVTRLELDATYLEGDLARLEDDDDEYYDDEYDDDEYYDDEYDEEEYAYRIKAITYPANADDASVTFTSNNTSVVSVDERTGVLQLKKPGTAIITCTTNDGSNLSKTCQVVLKQSRFEGEKKTVDGIKYKVTSDSYAGGTVTVYGVSNKNLKSYTVKNTVMIDGYSYKITGISNKAFKDCKKATSISLGTNIKSIGKEAFYNCKKLKTLSIKSKKIKTVGKNAFKNVNAKAKIKVPSSKLSKYKKLMKNKGQKKTVKIKKM